MAKIKYYKVVEAGSAQELQRMVNYCIDAGFEPIGGVSVCVLHTTWENERKGYEESSTYNTHVHIIPAISHYTYSQAVVDYYDA